MATDVLHDPPALDRRRSGRYGIDMIEQVAKLQSDVEYIKRDVADLKLDVRELRNEMRGEVHDLRDDIHHIRDRQERDFRLLFGALIAVAVGLAGMSAKGFGWL